MFENGIMPSEKQAGFIKAARFEIIWSFVFIKPVLQKS
ncbi:hypothetical protein l11_16340 [Neisseria weaveri LMG 5135]|nr:hypothetical protein l13_07060 [Neisseria weaveri ATCC 51223]EGV36686.1 hypothetical protein l11_16340 [Neisseria weaveri LMG 5135]